MDLAAVELIHIRLPFARPFVSARGAATHKDAILVRVRTSDGIDGWGECAAELAPTYAEEFIDSAWIALRDHIVPRARRNVALETIRGNSMAKAALEMAMLDAAGRRENRSLAEMLGASAGAAVSVGVVVELDDDLAVVVDRAQQLVAQGYRRVKVKIAPGHDDVVAAVRNALPNDVALWADANGSYRIDDAAHLAGLPLDLLEQPFTAGDVVDHARFLHDFPNVAVSLDESICSRHDAKVALAMRAAASLVVKSGRVGGLFEAAAIADACRGAGRAAWCGGMLETGIGRAANLALASLDGFTLPGDISATDRYFARDVTEPFVLQPDGTIVAPNGPGLGVEIDEAFVNAVAVRSEVL